MIFMSLISTPIISRLYRFKRSWRLISRYAIKFHEYISLIANWWLKYIFQIANDHSATKQRALENFVLLQYCLKSELKFHKIFYDLIDFNCAF